MSRRAIVEEGSRWWPMILTALALALLAQLVRVYIPLAFELGEQIGGTRGYLSAGAVALVVFAAPALASIGRLPARGRNALIGSVVVLAGARLTVQFVHPIPIWLGTVALAAGLFAIPIIAAPVRRIGGDETLLVGAFMGLALDTAMRAGALTWDLAWQGAAPFVIVSVALALLTVAASVVMPMNGRASVTPSAIRLVAFGPFFALQLLFLQNPAALASQAGSSLAAAAATILLIDALALVAGSVRSRIGPMLVSGLTVLVAIGGFLLADIDGPRAVIVFGGMQVLLFVLMGRALIPDRVAPFRPASMAWSCALGSLAFAGLVFAYQVAFEVPLPFSNASVPAVAAGAVGLWAIPRRGTVTPAVPTRTVAVPLALLVVPAFVGLSAPELATATAEVPTVRIVSYNIHGGVNVDGQVDPEATARVIGAQEPDVVVLNEVTRGWPIFGGLDAAEWLARRLEMPYVFEPAADLRFGNAILSRLPVTASSAGGLPFGAGPQRRSYLSVTFDVRGHRFMVIGTHLQESGGDPLTRTRQIEVLLDAWGGASPAIVAGDMNMQPGEDDVQLFLDAGLVSVQDRIGNPCEPSSFEPKPDKPCDRPDWIFATPDVGLTDFAIVRTDASDHLPLTVTVDLR